ncbi:MAG: hypothetical protein K0M40_21025 [Prolixibacteraceae bacterium]|nr:hypothetical protein [Prolixibacteraceae bacterium]
MNELEIKQLWQSTNEKLEESFVINRKNTEDITRLKVQNFVSSIKPIKIFTILVGILWVGILGTVVVNLFIFSFSKISHLFLFSLAIQVVLTAIALTIYIYQLITIYQVDITEPILKTQEKIANLKTTTLWTAKIMFLQLPVWTTFWWNETMLTDWNFLQWSILSLYTGSFTFLALWLFFNIKYENRDKKWFKFIFNGKEWTPLMKSMELLEQVNEYKIGTIAGNRRG